MPDKIFCQQSWHFIALWAYFLAVLRAGHRNDGGDGEMDARCELVHIRASGAPAPTSEALARSAAIFFIYNDKPGPLATKIVAEMA